MQNAEILIAKARETSSRSDVVGRFARKVFEQVDEAGQLEDRLARNVIRSFSNEFNLGLTAEEFLTSLGISASDSLVTFPVVCSFVDDLAVSNRWLYGQFGNGTDSAYRRIFPQGTRVTNGSSRRFCTDNDERQVKDQLNVEVDTKALADFTVRSFVRVDNEGAAWLIIVTNVLWSSNGASPWCIGIKLA